MLNKLAIGLLILVAFAGCGAPERTPGFSIDGPAEVAVFDGVELHVSFPAELRSFAELPDTQVHDAYDADRDGVYVRLSARFRHADGEVLTVPGFAMKEAFGERWQWRVRWSPYRPGTWRVTVRLEGRTAPDEPEVCVEHEMAKSILAKADKGIDGPLVAPAPDEHPGYLRRLKPDGASESLWLFGACRAWVSESQDERNDWYADEWLNRETELFAPMREGGFNLLNQWMAPWEFLLVHHDRAEHWRMPDGKWKRKPLPETAAWTSYQCYDQGRARAFDRLVNQCEGGSRKPTIHMLLSPLPHQCVQVREHPWGSQESGWSPENDAGVQSLERLNGYSGFRKGMSVWEFFEADPSRPLADWRSRLFDHQANFYRYVIARWSYSRAVGIWVIIDELDAVGDVVGVMAENKGWWGHPQCDQWLANVIRMFRGQLKRSDGMRYRGDPFRHPLHAATTSFGGAAGRGGNVDWPGGPPDARPDIFGWHWYPSVRSGVGPWWRMWLYTVGGVASYSKAPIGRVPRLISEFGAPDRDAPGDTPSRLYPTLYHHAIWAAVFAGQAGTPMDWDDGKQFGELRWRKRKGIFDREHYPIDHVEQLKALRRFLGDLRPDQLAWCGAKGARVTCESPKVVPVYALYRTKGPESIYGWYYTPTVGVRFFIHGLRPGKYRLQWFDPWTGEPVLKGGSWELLEAKKGEGLFLNGSFVLELLKKAARPFPNESRDDRGHDIAFKLVIQE